MAAARYYTPRRIYGEEERARKSGMVQPRAAVLPNHMTAAGNFTLASGHNCSGAPDFDPLKNSLSYFCKISTGMAKIPAISAAFHAIGAAFCCAIICQT